VGNRLLLTLSALPRLGNRGTPWTRGGGGGGGGGPRGQFPCKFISTRATLRLLLIIVPLRNSRGPMYCATEKMRRKDGR
jgi:hypothetical protein